MKRIGCLSRRGVLTGAAAAGLAGFAQAKEPKNQEDVGYQDHPHGQERCDNCEPFLPPDKCRTVKGTVSPQGWCIIYIEK